MIGLILTQFFNVHVKTTNTCAICKSEEYSNAWKCSQFSRIHLYLVEDNSSRGYLCFNCFTKALKFRNVNLLLVVECRGKHHIFLVGPSLAHRNLTHTQPRETVARTSLFSSGGETQVLLESCRAMSYGPEGNSSEIRVFFDSCSISFSFVHLPLRL